MDTNASTSSETRPTAEGPVTFTGCTDMRWLSATAKGEVLQVTGPTPSGAEHPLGNSVELELVSSAAPPRLVFNEKPAAPPL